MGGKKQNPISNFFIEIPPANTNPNITPPLESGPKTHERSQLLPEAVESLPTPAAEVAPAVTEALPALVQNDKILHPFFDKETRNAIQLQKSKSTSKSDKEALNLHKILTNDDAGKITKPRKRKAGKAGAKSEHGSRYSLPGLGSHDEAVDGLIRGDPISEGDLPTPSSPHSSDYEDSGVDEPPKERAVKKRRKSSGKRISLLTPPRSSEKEAPPAAKITLVGLPARSSPPPSTIPANVESPRALADGTNRMVLHVKNQPSTGTLPAVSIAARSAFDLMKNSSTPMTKTRSRSASPPPASTSEGPPAKKARTRGRPRKSVADVDITPPDASSPAVHHDEKQSLLVKLEIGKIAATKLLPPGLRPKLVVKLKLSKEVLEKFVVKPHPFFVKASGKQKQADESTTRPPTEPKPPVFKSNPFTFQPKPKFKIEHLPPWPSKDNIHVRNIGTEEVLPTPPAHGLLNNTSRKGKTKQSEVTPAEFVLEKLRERYSDLYTKYSWEDDSNGPPVSHPAVRVPGRKLIGASDVIKFIHSQIEPSRLYAEATHPAIRELMRRIGNREELLTAFDKSECETRTWGSLYEPTSSSCVLQTGQEARELGRWLACMKVTAVDNGTNSKPKAPVVKKKKKPKHELDDFVVSEDEDEDTMSDLTDPEDTEALSTGPQYFLKGFKNSEIRRKSRATVLSTVNPQKKRTNSPPARLPNSIMLSGPPGVGKTAAVLAAAKEHGFHIFEIHAGTKRGSKEIQELVGDMSRNHLVHQPKAQEQAPRTDSEQSTISKPTGFNSIFSKKDTQLTTQGGTQGVQAKEKPNQQQQQSLILIEEADTLFAEDVGFWRYIITLIQKSKRPVVITCNDESLIKCIPELDLYAILRFKPASPELAADYLLCMAAAQGHFLNRAMIRSVYESYNYDLRKSIAHLSFWCQMAIGDRTWCSRWFYLRDDPDKGNPRNAAGEVKRSISDGTYLPEMESFSRDLVIGENGRPLEASEIDEAAVWKDIQDGAVVDIGDRFYNENLESWMGAPENTWNPSCPGRGKPLLSAYCDYIESLSTLDAYQGVGVFTYDYDLYQIDPAPSGLKDFKEDGKDDDKDLSPDAILEVTLVDAERKTDPFSTSSMISITGQILARNILHNASRFHMPEETCNTVFAPLTEARLVDMISSNRKFREERQKKNPEDLRWPFYKIKHGGHSQIGRPMRVLVDTIPYIREIARYDLQNGEVAREMSSLISQRPGGGGGGGGGKKRTTRASAYASEGRSRGGARPRGEQYFGGSLKAMVDTGGLEWGEAVFLYTPRPEPDFEDGVAEGTAPVTGLQEIPQEAEQEAEISIAVRPSRRPIIHDDIEEWSSDA
ncbi:hypothetical protein TWF106_010942 [Orbilia oligospora]|uniref:AAA+ ATPase domain-containing protein n=1 Tax=Orbilia oligospora TaxID=2813651 RepID=A0A6G1MA49_ORBOL|nr:hypothetical protein TWF679_009538 [Orbilia oligospora]KAF3209588.1 hypothetical protein TWF106_010942 [Orbilia oligospora]KAF3221181.1 hypothetical protein TWF191_007150 [Orbilia oligospora]KAF3249903.1 hypothetical protein TWF192_005400 [Orbilia oligospora]